MLGLKTTLQSCTAAVLGCAMMTAMVGCTQAQVKQAAAEIGADIPKIQPYIVSAAALAATLDPVAAPIVTVVTATVQAGLTELAALCNSYAASPTDSVWQSIVATVNTLVNSGGNALLDAAKIVDPDSRAKALLVLGALQTALLLIDGVVQRTQSKAQTTAMLSERTYRLQQIAPYLDRQQVAAETGYSFDAVMQYELNLGA